MKLTHSNKIIIISGLTFIIGFSILYLIKNNFNCFENYQENYEEVKKVYPLEIKDHKLSKIIKKAIIIYHKYNYINDKLIEFKISDKVKQNIILNVFSIYTKILNEVTPDIKTLTDNTPNDELDNKIQDLVEKIIISFNDKIEVFNKILLACSSEDKINKLNL